MTREELADRIADLRDVITQLEHSVRGVLEEVSPHARRVDTSSIARDLASVIAARETPKAADILDEIALKYARTRPKDGAVRPGRVFARIYEAQEQLGQAWSDAGIPGKAPRRIRTGMQDFEKSF